MKIYKSKTKFHSYIFEYKFSRELLEFCRYVQNALPYGMFTFYDKGWRFTDMKAIELILGRYPETELDPMIQLKYDMHLEAQSADLVKKIEVERLKRAEDSNIEIKGIKGELRPYQKVGVEFFLASDGKAILGDTMGLGKLNFWLTLVITPSGWRKMGDLKVGDYVFARNGKPTKVIGVYPQGKKDLYRFTLTDGSSVLCGLEHLWKVRTRDHIRRNQDYWVVIDTKELLSRKLLTPKGTAKYMIPFADPVEMEERDFPIKPYTLGALIGNGCLVNSSISISVPKNKQHVLERIKKEHPEYTYGISGANTSSPNARFTNGRNGSVKNQMLEDIRALGLRIKSPVRFIPEQYKFGSVKQRLALLNGLMDTDGSCFKNRNTFYTMSEQLAKDVAEIVRSLSGEAIIRSYDRTYDRTKNDKRIEYQVNVRLDRFCPYSKESPKASAWKPAGNRGAGRYIKSIEFECNDEAVCIAVEDSEHLYITEDYIVTHNTLQALAYITTAEKKKSLIISPASVKYSWDEEIKKWTDLKPLVITTSTILDKKAYEEHDIFIINYDILKKHYSQLTIFKFDCLVVDEFHFIKNHKAQRTKAVKAIGKRIKSVLLLSGTPMLSRPVELFNGLNMMDSNVWNNYMNYTKKYCGGHQGYFGWDVKGATNINELQNRISRYFIRRVKEDVLKELPPKQYIDIPVELTQAVRKEYRLAVTDFIEYLRSVKNKTDKAIRKAMQAEKLVRLAALRQITTRGKVDDALETINNIIDSGEKVVVFSVYNESLEYLAKKLGKKAVLLTGKIDAEDRRDMIQKFQKNKKIQVFLGGTKSAGVGITLTSASNVLFIDYSWVPADHDQAADRIHRIGQKASNINVYQLYSKNTIDDYMRELLSGKKALFDRIIENKPAKAVKNSITKDLIKMIQKELDT